MKSKKLLMFSLATALLATVSFARADAEPMAAAVPQSDLNAFQSFLSSSDLASHWDGPPQRIDSDAIRAAYPDQRFYFTWKSKPVPPGAQLPGPQQRYAKAMEEHQKHSLKVTLEAGPDGAMQPFRSPTDFNRGLVKVTNASEAATAAAAIISLLSEAEICPAPVSVADVKATASAGGGWTCRFEQTRGITATVKFDGSGRCVSASKALNYTPPVPM
ncbi:MAG: hypothetical protein ABR526_07800 [Chthoniobacterales bacterium]